MKTFLISIVILFVLVAAFSTIDTRIEFEYPFGNWAVPSNTGASHPGEGEPGDGDAANSHTFSFGSEDEKPTGNQESQERSPITVEVVEPEKESNRWRNLEPLMRPLYYVALALAVILIVLIVIWIVLENSK